MFSEISSCTVAAAKAEVLRRAVGRLVSTAEAAAENSNKVNEEVEVDQENYSLVNVLYGSNTGTSKTFALR